MVIIIIIIIKIIIIITIIIIIILAIIIVIMTFQGDSLSQLLFVLSIVPLSLILRTVNADYEWGKKDYKLNYLHLLYMYDLKLFAQSEEHKLIQS